MSFTRQYTLWCDYKGSGGLLCGRWSTYEARTVAKARSDARGETVGEKKGREDMCPRHSVVGESDDGTTTTQEQRTS